MNNKINKSNQKNKIINQTTLRRRQTFKTVHSVTNMKFWYEYDTNEYSWRKIFEYIRISEYSTHYDMKNMIRTNIRIYSDQKNDTNEYTNIFVSKKGYEYDTNEYSWQKIFEYIRISEYSSHYVMPPKWGGKRKPFPKKREKAGGKDDQESWNNRRWNKLELSKVEQRLICRKKERFKIWELKPWSKESSQAAAFCQDSTGSHLIIRLYQSNSYNDHHHCCICHQNCNYQDCMQHHWQQFRDHHHCPPSSSSSTLKVSSAHQHCHWTPSSRW